MKNVLKVNTRKKDEKYISLKNNYFELYPDITFRMPNQDT